MDMGPPESGSTSEAVRTTAAWRAAGEGADVAAAGRCLAAGIEVLSPLTAQFRFCGPQQVQEMLAAAPLGNYVIVHTSATPPTFGLTTSMPTGCGHARRIPRSSPRWHATTSSTPMRRSCGACSHCPTTVPSRTELAIGWRQARQRPDRLRGLCSAPAWRVVRRGGRVSVSVARQRRTHRGILMTVGSATRNSWTRQDVRICRGECVTPPRGRPGPTAASRSLDFQPRGRLACGGHH